MEKLNFITAEKHITELDLSIVSDKDVMRVGAAFEGGADNVVVSSADSYFNTACAVKYALGEGNGFSRVIYTHFDKEDYLYTASMKQNSIDCVLKAALCRPFVVEDCGREVCFAENYLKIFEDMADKNTLVIVDGYDIPSPSPYMRHLFALDCRVLVLTQTKPKALYGTSVLVSFDGEKVPACFEELDGEEKELLMTLCGIFEHLDSSIPIESSKSGVFDKESLFFYVGTLAEKLDFLVQKDLVKILASGRIFVDRQTRKQVINKLSPSVDNCPCMKYFVEKCTDYRLIQDEKDISARLRISQGKLDVFSLSLEFINAYTYFSLTDKQAAVRLYNSLFCHIFKYGPLNEGTYYMGNLLLKNAAYYINLIADDEILPQLYDGAEGNKYMPCEVYTKSVRQKLDVIRLSISLIRNITIDMYKLYNPIFERLLVTMRELFDIAVNSELENINKMLLLDDVIRLCGETFSLFYIVDEHGYYSIGHDTFEKRRICYSCEPLTDRESGDGMVFGESVLTLKLYAEFTRYIERWLFLEETTPIKHRNDWLKMMHRRKCGERMKMLYLINSHFLRIITGYEKCVDIYVPANKMKNAFEYEIDERLEKRLEDNKRFMRRGFDGGTKRGAERYACLVINELMHSKKPLNVAATVVSPGYPLGDEASRLLIEKNLGEILLENKRLSNLSRQDLIETLVNFYPYAASESQTMLYEYLIDYLSDRVNYTQSFCVNMYRAVSRMYVVVWRHENKCVGENVENEYCKKLYERFCVGKEIKNKYCDEYIAGILYAKNCGGKPRFRRTRLEKAILVHGAEHYLCDTSVLSSHLGLQ